MGHIVHLMDSKKNKKDVILTTYLLKMAYALTNMPPIQKRGKTDIRPIIFRSAQLLNCLNASLEIDAVKVNLPYGKFYRFSQKI